MTGYCIGRFGLFGVKVLTGKLLYCASLANVRNRSRTTRALLGLSQMQFFGTGKLSHQALVRGWSRNSLNRERFNRVGLNLWFAQIGHSVQVTSVAF